MSGNRANDRYATYDVAVAPSPVPEKFGCSTLRYERPLWMAPSTSDSISPLPHVLRGTDEGGGSASDPDTACWNSHASSVEVACRAYRADPARARPMRSDCSVHRAISFWSI